MNWAKINVSGQNVRNSFQMAVTVLPLLTAV